MRLGICGEDTGAVPGRRWRFEGNDSAGQHDRPVGNLKSVLDDVGGHHDRATGVAILVDHVIQSLNRMAVEPGFRFVEQQKPGFVHQRTGQGDPFLKPV